MKEKVDNYRYCFVPKNHKGWLMRACSCACCDKCWIYVEGPWIGTCQYGGPFEGYKNYD